MFKSWRLGSFISCRLLHNTSVGSPSRSHQSYTDWPISKAQVFHLCLPTCFGSKPSMFLQPHACWTAAVHHILVQRYRHFLLQFWIGWFDCIILEYPPSSTASRREHSWPSPSVEFTRRLGAVSSLDAVTGILYSAEAGQLRLWWNGMTKKYY